MDTDGLYWERDDVHWPGRLSRWCAELMVRRYAQGVKELVAEHVWLIDGIAIRDRPEDLAAFLARHGDPYGRIGNDATSKVQIALGSSGVPETFVIDARGIVRHQHIGAVEASDMPKLLLELDKAR